MRAPTRRLDGNVSNNTTAKTNYVVGSSVIAINLLSSRRIRVVSRAEQNNNEINVLRVHILFGKLVRTPRTYNILWYRQVRRISQFLN